jgi:glucose/arabinose dehydrogenase
MTRHFIRSIVALFFVAVLAGCAAPGLPPSDPDNGDLILPGGFEALVVADSVGRARHIAVNDNGDIYVKLTRNDAMKGKGGTVGLRDLNGDGKADSIVYFGDYTDIGGSAVGVTIHNGYLYTSTVSQILRNKLKDGELVPTSKTELILTDEFAASQRAWHTTKPLAFDKKGNMYVPFGGPTNAGQDINLYGPAGIPNGRGLDPAPDLVSGRGSIWRFDANKENQTQKDGYRFATGVRSIVGMTWSPLDDHLYAVVNGIDNFHTLYPSLYTSWQAAVLPAETLVKVTDGANYGWPYAYYDQFLGKNMLEPGYGGDGKIVGRAAEFDLPVFGFPGHWAPMDVMFYQGNQFPERYKKGVFIAFHGSSDRAPYPQAGYIVCFLAYEDGKWAKDYEVFADGFAQVDTVKNTSDAVYRPMGLSEGPDGSLYISESNKGKIWRVMYKGDKNNFGDAQLAALKQRKETVSYIKTPDSVTDKLNKGSELAGGILYNTYCSTCHARDGLGDNNRYPPLAGSEIVTGDKSRLIDIVMNGLQGPVQVKGKTWDGLMPAHGAFLDDVAIASITTYIRKNRRFQNNSDAVSPEEVAKVRATTRKKKN